MTVDINKCRNCDHTDHSGSFTVRGARSICGHSDACKERRSKTAFRKEYPEYTDDIKDMGKDWKYHWYHRIIDPDKKPPVWCPLRHGSRY